MPWTKSLPTIWVTRWIRDFLLFIYHWLCGHRSYAEVRSKMGVRKDVEIEFLGLFDTVEAFGVPIEELRLAVDWAIWPISFRNHRLSHKVRQACHALALDDERTTFHPLRIDQSHLGREQIVKEVWFAGVHSDIGGGYPESTLSFVPLVWMVEQLGGRLRFQDGEIEHFQDYQSAIGPRHDSRSGAAVLYRYGPRPILAGRENGGEPVVHFAVIERMLFGCDDYAPIMLPADCRVLLPNDTKLPDGTVLPGGTRLPDGTVLPDGTRPPDGAVLPAGTTLPLQSKKTDEREKELEEQLVRALLKIAYLAKATGPRRKLEAEAFITMSTPDPGMSSLTRDTVWWRRVAYFSLLFMVAFIAVFPWIARGLVGSSEDGGLRDTWFLKRVTDTDWLLSAVVAPLTNILRHVLPAYATPWLDIATYYPVLTSAVLLLTLWVWNKNSVLRDNIQERARLAWNTPRRKASREHITTSGRALRFGNWMRHNMGWAQTLFARRLMPIGFLFIIFSSALLMVSTSYFTGRVALGRVCSAPEVKTASGPRVERGKPVLDEALSAGSVFETRDFCWWSGLAVEKGRKYRVWLDIDEPWFDRTIMTGVNGFGTDLARYIFLPMRRLYGADWFQPVVRIGSKGINDIPLTAINVEPADVLPRRKDPTLPAEDDLEKSPDHRYWVRVEDELGDNDPHRAKLKALDGFLPIQADDLPVAREVWKRQNLTGRVVAEFVAPDSGELFFYVNDAVQIFPTVLPCCFTPWWLAPFQGRTEKFYDNNSGTARIKVQRLPVPPQPPEKPAQTVSAR
ncbi:T6SS phospholipase effector Tle1-like catalytic domain-containing protein [Bradyrhizobium sp. SEMIA]|uniref:phospholipase effector Tle1 domain-containing protein n=1 Tax=Bradyrhizobium sp. SEMIA TaxID=2597515 RepID=UPI00223F4322